MRIYLHGAAVPPFTLVCSIYLLEKLPNRGSARCSLQLVVTWAILLVFWSSSALLTVTLPLEIDIYVDADGNLDPSLWRHPLVDYYSSLGYVVPGVVLTFLLSFHGVLCTKQSKGSILLGVASAEPPCTAADDRCARRLL